MKTQVISGFPGVGKSYFVEKNPSCLDSDSSVYSWSVDDDGERIRNPNFPKNYISHIEGNMGKVPIIFVSTHKEIRDALVENDIPFTLVYPRRDLKEEYLNRYRARKSPEGLINVVAEKWDAWINEMEETHCDACVLSSGEFLDMGVVLSTMFTHLLDKEATEFLRKERAVISERALGPRRAKCQM